MRDDALTSLVDKKCYELCFIMILSYAIITNAGNSLLVGIVER